MHAVISFHHHTQVLLIEVWQPFEQLLLPHQAKRRGHDDQARPFALVHFGDGNALQRLAEAHLVADQRTSAVGDGELDQTVSNSVPSIFIIKSLYRGLFENLLNLDARALEGHQR